MYPPKQFMESSTKMATAIYSRRRRDLCSRKTRRLKFAREAKKTLGKYFWLTPSNFILMKSDLLIKQIQMVRPDRPLTWHERNPRRDYRKLQRARAISHGHGTVNGQNFADFVLRCFPEAFGKLGVSPAGNKFLRDSDPRQNSKAAFETLGCEIFSIFGEEKTQTRRHW